MPGRTPAGDNEMTSWYLERTGPGWEVGSMIDREDTYLLRLKAIVDGKKHFIRIRVPSKVMREISPLWTCDLGERTEPMSDLELLGLFRAHASVDGRDTRWMKGLIL